MIQFIEEKYQSREVKISRKKIGKKNSYTKTKIKITEFGFFIISTAKSFIVT